MTTQDANLLAKFLNSEKLTKLKLNLSGNNIIKADDFKSLLESIIAQKELASLGLNLNGTQIYLSEMVDLIHSVRKKKTLEELELKISNLEMHLKDLKILLRPLRGIHRLSNLNMDVRIKDKNNLNMLKSFSHLATLSQLSVNLSRNKIIYEGAKKLLRPLARYAHLT